MPTHPPDAPVPQPPGDAAQAWLVALPSPLLRVDAAGIVRWRNPAADALFGSAVCLPGARLPDGWDDATAPVLLTGPVPGPPGDPGSPPGPGATERWGRLRRTALPDGGLLLQIDDATAEVQARREAARLAEILDLARNAGRLGVWERDVRTLQGQWDRQILRFWGLDATPTPDFDTATQQILPEDRPGVDAAFRASLQRPGVYTHRFRVRRPDGSLTHVHSHWAVKADAQGRPNGVVGIMVDDTETIERERRQRELASQLDLAEDLAGLILWRHDLLTDRMHFNAPGWALLERAPDPDGVPAAEVRAVIHPDDLSSVLEVAQAGLAGDGPLIADAEARHRQRDGSWRHVLTRRALQRDETGRPVAFLGVALDVTARSAEERRARELAQRFELATRTGGLGYWAREGDAERAYWSAQMRALHDLPDDAPVPTLKEWLARFVHPQDREQVRARFAEWLWGSAPDVRGEFRIITAAGRERHLVTHSLREREGTQPVLFGIALDVTVQRQADIALRRADERAALAARGAGIGTWELDPATGAIVWDEQMWRLRGRAPRPAPPTTEEFLAFVHPDDLALAGRHVRAAFDQAEALAGEFRVVWPDGSVRWLASRSSALLDHEGRVARRIGVNWDVTDARRAESERREREAAEQASQAKSRFLARMSHELRTPLNAVLGFAQLIESDDDPALRAQRLAHIRSAGQHLLSLIDDVLDLTGLDSGDLRMARAPVALRPLVEEVVPLLDSLRADRGVALDIDVDDGVVAADATRLRQIVLNLLSNGYKYNRPGGRVAIVGRAAGPVVTLEVIDTGRGMDDGQLRELFQPFNRLGAEASGIPGTGIGLVIVKALVERMGGRVTVDSAVGAGTRVSLQLPAAARAPALPVGPAVPAGPDVTAGERLDPARGVLYVEDNAVNALIVQELLASRPGLRLRVAADGASGLAMARSDTPALMLLDLQLPDMDGLDVLRALRADPSTARSRCVVLSASALPEDVARARQAGADDYWTKPVDLAAFRDALDRWFGLVP